MTRDSALSTRVFLVPVFALGWVAALISAQAQQSAKPAPSPAAGGFTVAITYSQKATETLLTLRELEIGVTANVFGYPKPGTPKQYIPPSGTIALGSDSKQITMGDSASFGKIDLDPANLKDIDSRGPQLQIIISPAFANGQSAGNDPLDCGTFQTSFSAAQGKTLHITCKAAGES